MTPDEQRYLRRAIQLAQDGVASGGEPYGSLLVGPDGDVLAEDFNTVAPDRDISAHPELKLAVWAARELESAVAAGTTMFTSCQPCSMFTGALARSGLGRVVFALSNQQHAGLVPGESHPDVPLDGPALFEEARRPIEGYYGPRALGD
jgi:tRNA(Arg) A34 adenosine deaminase TadA